MKYLELDYRVIEGWDNYVVTSCGRVFKRSTGVEVSQVLTGEPQYKYVNLRQDKRHKLIRVHRLVALAFLPVVEGKDFVDHIDRDKMNNVASNLRWATASENQRNQPRVRLLGCGSTGIEHLTTNELNFADNNNLLSLSIEDIKTVYSLCRSIGYSYKKLIEPLEINGETNTIGAWCVYLGVSYKVLVQNIKPKCIKGVWFSQEQENRVHLYRRKTNKELTYDSHQRKLAEKHNMSVEEYLNKDVKVVIIGEKEVKYKTLVDLCATLNVNVERISARIKKQGMSLEEALQAPLGRVNKWLYGGEVYSVKELCSAIGLSQRKFINSKAKYGESFMDKLGIGHLGIQPYVL
mgnify:FL=1